MSRRFFCPGPWPAGVSESLLELTGPEAHHARHVLRKGLGDELVLFDGAGHQARAEIREFTAAGLKLALLEITTCPEPTAALTIAVAFPKGDRAKWMIEKLTELGVSRCVPLLTERTIVDPGSGKLDKLRQTIVEASKQCGRNDLLELTAPVELRRLPGHLASETTCWIAAPGGMPVVQIDLVSGNPQFTGTCVLIGPEGGWTSAELSWAEQQGIGKLGLGPRILRIETAAIAVASLFGCR